MRRKTKRTRKKVSYFRYRLYIIASVFSLLVVFLAGSYYFLTRANLSQCANSISCIKDLSGDYEKEAKEGVFLGRKITVPPLIAKGGPGEEKVVLGETIGGDKHIYVDLTNQQLSAYENGRLVYNFPISSGKWYPTPPGEFRIWIKLRYTRMAGGNPAIGTYYDLPNVPYTMYFYSDQVPKSRGFSLHGAYWHNNFGHPMSHGCVNISPENAGKLYYWANPPISGNVTYASPDNLGTPVTIYGETPAE